MGKPTRRVKKLTAIDTVVVLRRGEKVAWVLTDRGGFVVTPIPDPKLDRLEDVRVLAPSPNLALARAWMDKIYMPGLS